ncbi:MAG TPA: chorismate synthase [Terriglobales bacterium]|nr:chorismate synthase [Terriglobales bacterium]
MLRFSTAGESHGQALLALLSGLPAGLPLDPAFVAHELWRRQQGYGRGGRMKIERDTPEFLSGIRNGSTIGAPVAILIPNHDWQNWHETLSVEAPAGAAARPVSSPRPGHADLAGALKFNFPEARYVLERASARETAARVAAGALAKLLLRALGIEVLSHVVAVGEAALDPDFPVTPDSLRALAARDEILLHCLDPDAEQRMKAEVDQVLRTGDTIGGVFEVRAFGLPPGLGTCANWDERLDGRLAQALMSIQAVKAVEIGAGVASAAARGSLAQDPIGYDPAARRFTRAGNHAGGLEGGITNGQELVLRGFLKPISTLRRPLPSVDFATRQPVKAAYERSDVCVVPAAAVVAEAMAALVLAQAALEKFGGDSLPELQRNYNSYLEQVRAF